MTNKEHRSLTFHEGYDMTDIYWILKDRICVCKINGVPAIDFKGNTKMEDARLWLLWENSLSKRVDIESLTKEEIKDKFQDFLKLRDNNKTEALEKIPKIE